MSARVPGGAVVSALLVLSVLGLLGLQFARPWHTQTTALGPRPWPVGLPGEPPPRVALGAITLALARNGYRPWQAHDLLEINAFEQRARRHVDIVSWFEDWHADRDFNARQAAAVAARRSIPEITWEPWDPARGLRTPQPRYRLRQIIAGAYDRYIRRWATRIATYRGPIRLRFAQEMNGRWYPWSEALNGNRRGEFVRAWRHVRAVFRRAGATNVTWIWSPVVGAMNTIANLYPGPGEVDVLGLSGFNGGTAAFGRTWRPFRALYSRSLGLLHRLDPSKPVALAELASAEAGGDKASWIDDVFASIKRRPYVRSITWFNVRKEADWRIESTPRAQRAFADGINRIARPGSGR